MKYSHEIDYVYECKEKSQVVNDKVKRFWSILTQKETLAYIIVGTMTTGVNMVAYYLLCNVCGIANLLSNAFAWVIAMFFAYFANAKYVFKPAKKGFVDEVLQIGRFFTARFVSFLVEELAMYVCVDLLLMNNLLIKAIMNVIVVIINYYFSKLVVFKD